MGRLVYDSLFEVEFEDRVLAHLQVVVGVKLVRGESFYLSWTDSVAVGNGRSSIWLHPASPLRFRYSSARRIAMNPDWIQRWIADSHAPGGLRFTDEPPPRSDLSNVLGVP